MDDIGWLQEHDEPWSDVVNKWQATFIWRINEMQEQRDAASLNTFLNKWPALNVCRSFELIDLDFKTMFPDIEETSPDKFKEMKEKLLPIFNLDIKDKFNKGLLGKLSASNNEDSQICIMSMLINALIIPNREPGNKKPSISAAQQEMIVRLPSSRDLEAFRNETTGTDIKIIVIGETLTDLTDFYVNCGAILFKTPSMSKALDIGIKLSIMFTIGYSRKCKFAWELLEAYYFGSLSTRTFDPKVQNVLNKLS
ncbi:uncharacterized protein LOC129801927 [Phlebotomus papatasi]|uniref:uncharacterized protein LOC129801927 n=1 Tax=Phlebotomus papatasi TaxID=29031 RepID=UPI0024845AD2|nr:uncharacterized protein LOC129801927 [Phlebotomus papatasi]